MCKVEEFYDFKNGLNKEKEFFGSGVPIVNFVDVFHNRGLTPEMLKGRVTLSKKEIKNFEVKQGDIFFTRTSETINEIGYPSVMLGVPTDTVFSGFVLRGRARSVDPMDNLFKRYVFFTESFRNEMVKKSSMTTRALTSGTAIKEMYVQYPSSKDEQHKIGAFLAQIDDTIALHQRKLDQLKELKKAYLQLMFASTNTKNDKLPKLRFTGFKGYWELCKLKEIVDVRSGRDYKHLGSGNIPVYGTGGYMLSVSEALSYDEDAIGIGRKGTINNPYILKAPFWTVDTLFYAIPKNNFDLNFIYSIFRKINWKSKDESTGVPSLSKTTINAVTVYIPSGSEQQRIGEFFKQIDNTITLHQR
ncbi:restriction endonuclease subunit S, partial [Enterococcus faecalis]|uniref:restriction endonuclease subunit S n=2 Tax=Enterococcus faecalis TaxID=1351 RepID=UPI001E3C5C3C